MITIQFPKFSSSKTDMSSSFNEMIVWLNSNNPKVLEVFEIDYTAKTVFFKSKTTINSQMKLDGYSPAKAVVLKRGADIVLNETLMERFEVALLKDAELLNLHTTFINWIKTVKSLQQIQSVLKERGIDVELEFDSYVDFQNITIYNSCSKCIISKNSNNWIDIQIVKNVNNISNKNDQNVIETNIDFIINNLAPNFWIINK